MSGFFRGFRALPIRSRLAGVPGVVQMKVNAHNSRPSFEIEVDKGRDVRAELARAIVSGGWNLLELRTMGMSLEEIFLELTRAEKGAEPAARGARSQEVAQ